MRIASVGHAIFAATMIGLGILGLIKGDFTPVWAPVPEGMPAHAVLAYLCAIISLTTGMGLLWRGVAAHAARLMLAYLLLWFLLLRVRAIILTPTFGVFWPGFETAVMVAGAWVLYTWFATDWDRRRLGLAAGDKGLRIARGVYGLASIFFGMAHFIDPRDTLVLEPSWLPWHLFWVYFFGCTFIAAGVGVLIGVYGRLAAALSVLQLSLFTLLVWVPMLAVGSENAFQLGETIVSVALTASAWVVADSYRGMRWLAVNRR
jgi:uncharacterized membrane protein